MSKIIIGTAHGHNVGFDVALLLATRLLITADSGGGKSWLARVLFEQAFGKLQIIIIDPEGEFSSLREKFPFVLAGKGGDTPIDLRSAGMLAHRLLKLRVSAVCDLYEMKAHERHIWVRDFFNALIEAPKDLRVPLLLGVDEFHVFAPEKGQGESEAKQASIDIATRGRKRGICLAGITQRLAMLDKNITSQLQNRLIGPTFEEVNIKTAVRLLGIAPGAQEREFHQQIQLLEPGHFFAFGRAISRERILIKVREVTTTHPKAFEKHSVPLPPTPEKIKGLLPQLADLPKEAEDKARTEAEYKREIRELKTQLSAASRQSSAKPAAADPGVTQHQIERQIARALKDRDSQWQGAISNYQRAVKERFTAGLKPLTEAAAAIAFLKVETPIAHAVMTEPPPAPKPAAPNVPKFRSVRNVQNADGAAPIAAGEVKLGDLHRQVAGILAAYHPKPVSIDLLAAMCGRTPGGSFSARLSEVRAAGLLVDASRGQVLATDKCVQEFLGSFTPPSTTEEVLTLWKPKLGDIHKQVLDELIKRNGDEMSIDELAAAVGRAPGGSFSARLSEIRSKNLLVDVRRGYVAANKEALFLEAA